MDLHALLEPQLAPSRLRVPPSPVAALRLMRLVQRDDTEHEDLVACVMEDQSLAAVVLRLANSAAYRRSSPVTSLGSAILSLGRRVLVDVAFSHRIHEQTLRSGSLLPLRRRAWRESLVAANVAQWIAPMVGANPHEAYAAGLLHSIGRVPVIGALERVLELHPALDSRTEDGWWEVVNDYQRLVGGMVAATWQLPVALASIIEGESGVETRELERAVRAAEQVVALLDGAHAVPAGRLAVLGVLTAPQCVELAKQLPKLPALLDAFRDVGGGEEPRVVEYRVERPEGQAGTLPVALHVDGNVVEGHVLALGLDELVVDAPLVPGRLVRVRVGALSFHARVTSSDTVAAELAPWALDDEQRAGWVEVVRTHAEPESHAHAA